MIYIYELPCMKFRNTMMNIVLLVQTLEFHLYLYLILYLIRQNRQHVMCVDNGSNTLTQKMIVHSLRRSYNN